MYTQKSAFRFVLFGFFLMMSHVFQFELGTSASPLIEFLCLQKHALLFIRLLIRMLILCIYLGGKKKTGNRKEKDICFELWWFYFNLNSLCTHTFAVVANLFPCWVGLNSCSTLAVYSLHSLFGLQTV